MTDSRKDWFVMAEYEGLANKTLFPLNALNLTKDEAEAEADRRTAADHAAGYLNVLWFPGEDIMAHLRRIG